MDSVIDYSATLIEVKTNLPVPAVVQCNLSPQTVLAAESIWGPHRIASVLKMVEEGADWAELPEHLHWNWSNKLKGYNPIIHRFVDVSADGEMQGLMRVDIATARSRSTRNIGQALVYVDFLESAPWNARQLSATLRYKLAGFRLVEAAMTISVELGFQGRIGLHALPQACGFYERACGLTAFESDPEHEGLTYFELPHLPAVRIFRGES